MYLRVKQTPFGPLLRLVNEAGEILLSNDPNPNQTLAEAQTLAKQILLHPPDRILQETATLLQVDTTVSPRSQEHTIPNPFSEAYV